MSDIKISAGSTSSSGGDDEKRQQSAQPHSKKRVKLILSLALMAFIFAGCVVGYVLYTHQKDHADLENVTQEMSLPTVQVVHPQRQSASVDLVLPGRVQAFMETPVYSRVNGYLKRWLVDIGTKVKAGQLLAEIDTPETDQQLNQARAALSQAEANRRFAESTAKRWQNLLKNSAVSPQEAEEKENTFKVSQANYEAALANVRRLEELQSFQKIYAPFDGIVTERRTDVGSLVNAGSGTAAQELFHVSQMDTLRVYVNVPEVYSSYITPGIIAKMELASSPGATIEGKLVRNSGAIDSQTHTLLAEVQVPNSDGKLLPGGYAQVHFNIHLDSPPLVLPANSLIFRGNGTQVGVVDAQSQLVKLVEIKVGRDFGTKLEVLQGVEETDLVIVNPSDSLVSGIKVNLDLEKQETKKAQVP